MADNLHGTAVILGDRGVFIQGRSGTGKTELALELLARVQSCGQFARLVADDQLFTSSAGGKLLMTAPETIVGMVEVRGLGPRSIAVQGKAVIDLVVTLVDPKQAERMPESSFVTLHSVRLPELKLAAHNVHDAASVVLAQLDIGLFDAVYMRQNG
ncbi:MULTISPECIES: HPr kinase/phosphorylase [Mesorhizobium]|uniref:HPr kinase/phosphorylase n=1 Tax=Mesorhizobium denitrificans TaxID=2294114 RepID=A0A371XHP8_9HYPH|nr:MULTISPECIES: HPr kinase/phosphatase C-terminal domain-containing protein [Mesorhizobium]RFC68564.1 HPr kinase/phosphorylase [Mesorhizobium denitrificans]